MNINKLNSVMKAFGCKQSKKYCFYNLSINFDEDYAIVTGNIPEKIIELMKDKYHYNLLDVKIENSYINKKPLVPVRKAIYKCKK